MSLKTIVSTTLGIFPDRVTDDLSLDNCEEWTSLAHLALISELERAFATEFDIMESISMDSVGAIREVLRDKGFSVDD